MEEVKGKARNTEIRNDNTEHLKAISAIKKENENRDSNKNDK